MCIFCNQACFLQRDIKKSMSDKPQTNVVAVLTGDIVKSQSLTDLVFNTTIKALKEQLQGYSSKYQGDYDIFRGDAFQFVTQQPHKIIDVAVALRLSLKALSPSIDIRISCAVGNASFREGEIKTGIGEAFVVSGRGLDKLKTQYIAFDSAYESISHTHLLTRFADTHLAGLTQTQSETVLAYLMSEDKNHDSVASSLGKNRSNITRILNASHYKLIADYLDYMEQHIKTALQA